MTMTPHLYPQFEFAYDTRLKYDGSERTKDEALDYYNSFQRTYPYRVLILLSWFNESISMNPEADLLRIGDKVSNYLKLERISRYKKAPRLNTLPHIVKLKNINDYLPIKDRWG